MLPFPALLFIIRCCLWKKLSVIDLLLHSSERQFWPATTYISQVSKIVGKSSSARSLTCDKPHHHLCSVYILQKTQFAILYFLYLMHQMAEAEFIFSVRPSSRSIFKSLSSISAEEHKKYTGFNVICYDCGNFNFIKF